MVTNQDMDQSRGLMGGAIHGGRIGVRSARHIGPLLAGTVTNQARLHVTSRGIDMGDEGEQTHRCLWCDGRMARDRWSHGVDLAASPGTHGESVPKTRGDSRDNPSAWVLGPVLGHRLGMLVR